MKAQSSLEFLVFASISVVFIVSAAAFFSLRSAEVGDLKRADSMMAICREVASKAAFVHAGGDGTSTKLELPDAVMGKNISISAFPDSSLIIVRDDERPVGCSLNIRAVTNGSDGPFEIGKNASFTNQKGVVYVG